MLTARMRFFCECCCGEKRVENELVLRGCLRVKNPLFEQSKLSLLYRIYALKIFSEQTIFNSILSTQILSKMGVILMSSPLPVLVGGGA